jgi:maltose phosphorylase
MNKYIKLDPWCIIEEGFKPELNRGSESLFSLGNGYMGQRANFEEHYSGDTLLGNYIAGVYYPDPTKVGWWKNGYPEYYAKIVNITNWLGIDVKINVETLDLANCQVSKFKRILNMYKGTLERSFVAKLKNNKKVKVNNLRFLSMVDKELAVIKYSITPLSEIELTISPYLDSDVRNESTNYNEKFLDTIENKVLPNKAFVTTMTRKHSIYICTGMEFDITKNNKKINFTPELVQKPKYVANQVTLKCKANETITIYKYIANVSSRDYKREQLQPVCEKILAKRKTYATMLKEHQQIWKQKWQQNDVIIEGDLAAQQAIRFNIFQISQTFTGQDPRLNVNPKGFTGEKYGATIQWDSEALCVPYYLSTAQPEITKNLLLYRYNHLQKAIKNARSLGFIDGAALFPMATVNGDECQNEWEITFEEIHRNGAIAHAIYNYVRYTNDKQYLIDYGLEVLIALARFWSQRVHFSKPKNQYVIHGVTGPNEYENNVNNNWHTNNIAHWTLEYTIEVIKYVSKAKPEKYKQLCRKLKFVEQTEMQKWQEIINNMYFPTQNGIFLQQENYLDKEQILAKDLNPAIRPLNQYWSWDRILRSCFIKQADVLQGIYFFLDKYDHETIKKNFDFHEPRTVHESSLSACVHAILAARLNYQKQAYQLFLRASRLDLDDYNNEVKEGCHITSMAGSWLAITHGYAGLMIKNNNLHLDPIIIPKWQAYSFKVLFRKNLLTIRITKKNIKITNQANKAVNIVIFSKPYTIKANNSQIIKLR